MKHILVSTDFSDAAARAYDIAVELARKFGANITLVHAVDSTQPAFAVPMLDNPTAVQNPETLIEAAKNHLQEERKKLPGDLDVAIAAPIGTDAAQTLKDFAEQNGASAMVLATHGRSGLGRLLLGSVAEQVLRHSPIPVMVVPVRD